MPRPGTAAGLLLALALVPALAGCFFRKSEQRASEWLDRMRAAATPEGTIALRTVLIERPVGDRYLAHDLWAAANKPLTHEHATLLARNGVRVGVFSGVIPGEFDRLVHSEHATVNPIHRTTQPGAPKVIPVNGPLERCAYQAQAELTAEPTQVDLAAAECGLSVTAQPADGGRVRLVCELQVQHGERQAFLKPTSDGTSFAREDRKPLEAYPTLTWQVTLGPTDYLVVGPADDVADTLGRAFFFTGHEDQLRQRVLVIRTMR
jgi:hypothetical protein